ncbi:hypothetical protein AB0O83_43300, partial [Streptomyces sp. NPDC088141]
MTSGHDMLWRRCAYLGRVLLPLLDQELWRQDRRQERLQSWGIDTAVGERLIEVFAALAAHAVAVDASLSAAEFEILPLSAVADAATGKQDFELLAGLPDTFADDRDEIAVKIFRLYAYIPADAIAEMERCERPVTVDDLVAIAYALNTTPRCCWRTSPSTCRNPRGLSAQDFPVTSTRPSSAPGSRERPRSTASRGCAG